MRNMREKAARLLAADHLADLSPQLRNGVVMGKDQQTAASSNTAQRTAGGINTPASITSSLNEIVNPPPSRPTRRAGRQTARQVDSTAFLDDLYQNQPKRQRQPGSPGSPTGTAAKTGKLTHDPTPSEVMDRCQLPFKRLAEKSAWQMSSALLHLLPRRTTLGQDQSTSRTSFSTRKVVPTSALLL